MIPTAAMLWIGRLRLAGGIAAVLSMAGLVSPAAASGYFMEGFMIRRNYSQSGELASTFNYRFLIKTLATNGWVEVEMEAGSTRTIEIGSTYGGDIYFLKRILRADKSVPEEHAMVTERFPTESSDAFQVLFAFLTTSLVPVASKAGSAFPFSMIEETDPANVALDVLRAAEAPGLVIRASAMAPGFLEIPDGAARRRVELLPPHADGYLVWSYEAIGRKAFNGLSFPGAFSFRRFFPKETNPESSEPLSLVTEMAGTIEKLGSIQVTLPRFPQPVNRVVKVADFRFAPNTPPPEIPAASRQLFYYAITNGNWRVRNDQFFKAEIATMSRIESGQGGNASNTAKRIVIWVAFAVVILVPVVWSILHPDRFHKMKP